MVKAKKYTLQKLDKSNPQVCSFFISDQGCRTGESCRFLHEKKGDVLDDGSSSSAVSSESSSVPSIREEKRCRKKSSNVPKQVSTNNERKRKSSSGSDTRLTDEKPKQRKEKRGTYESMAYSSEDDSSVDTKSSDDDPFLSPEESRTKSKKERRKSQSSEKKDGAGFRDMVLPVTPCRADLTKGKKDKEDSRRSKDKKVKEHKSRTSKDEEVKEDGRRRFQELALPVSPFNAPSKKKSKEIGFPISTPDGKEWLDTVKKTRAHEKFDSIFSFKNKDRTWVKSKPFGAWCSQNPQIIAIDCEMCETVNEKTEKIDGKALCRFTVVNGINMEEVLIDTLVRPRDPITDDRSRINGITKDSLENVHFSLQHAQQFMSALCSDETVIVGHAVHNDLQALKFEHYCVVDSALLFKVRDLENATPSLKDLSASLLGKEMPELHDSVNDAVTALKCCEIYREKDGNVDPIVSSKASKPSLVVHRIPSRVTTDHLYRMFLEYTHVKPEDIPEIVFKNGFGRSELIFKSEEHAVLAFESFKGKFILDKGGFQCKKVYMRNKDYIVVRNTFKTSSNEKQESD